jgi:hypothetical protein
MKHVPKVIYHEMLFVPKVTVRANIVNLAVQLVKQVIDINLILLDVLQKILQFWIIQVLRQVNDI